MKSKCLKMLSLINSLALFTVIQTANSTCLFCFHQPEFPKEAKKYVKK